MATEVNEGMDKLKDDIATLRSDISSLVSALKDAGIESGQTAYSRARAAGEQAHDHVAAAQDTLDREIQKRPMTSVMSAFAVGFIAGMLLDRRR